VVLGVLALAATAVVVPWALARDDAPSVPSTLGDAGSHAGTARRVPAAPAAIARRVGSVAPEIPTALRLPSGTEVPVEPVSSKADGELAVPDDVRHAGWWRGGSRIGDPFGSTLVAGHVDSATQGLGRFAELLAVRPGQVVVVRTHGLRQAFRVTSLRLVAQGTLPRHPWIYAVGGPRRLTLVTCAPPYVPAAGGYQNLAVVTARPLGEPSPRRHP
jgi:hypothetical protein